MQPIIETKYVKHYAVPESVLTLLITLPYISSIIVIYTAFAFMHSISSLEMIHRLYADSILLYTMG